MANDHQWRHACAGRGGNTVLVKHENWCALCGVLRDAGEIRGEQPTPRERIDAQNQGVVIVARESLGALRRAAERDTGPDRAQLVRLYNAIHRQMDMQDAVCAAVLDGDGEVNIQASAEDIVIEPTPQPQEVRE